MSIERHLQRGIPNPRLTPNILRCGGGGGGRGVQYRMFSDLAGQAGCQETVWSAVSVTRLGRHSPHCSSQITGNNRTNIT